MRRRLNPWERTMARISDALRRLARRQCYDPFFRGHRKSSWKLRPQLARRHTDESAENRLFYRFLGLGGWQVPQTSTSWDVLFLMQHHGVPTRLLDWTQSFAVALYFAIHKARGTPTIWILDPYRLNKLTADSESIVPIHTRYPEGYEDYFVNDKSPHFGKFPADILAVGSIKPNPRMRSQLGLFTLHKDLRKPLEALYPQTVVKIEIPKSAIDGARKFLALAGINEYTLFPDLDGLGRYLIESEIDE